MQRNVEDINSIAEQPEGGSLPGWYRFLKRAFFPPASDNNSPERFEMAASHLVVAPQPRNVLDLGAGDCLYLAGLLKKHAETGHLVDKTQGQIKYCAVDSEFGRKPQKWKVQDADKICPQCFAKPWLRPAPLEHPEFRKIALDQGPFDLILATNLLHELPPAVLVDLLLFLPGALRPGGLLYVVDPDANWSLSDDAWAGHWEDASEWETDAVWYRAKPFEEILRSFGFADAYATEHHGSKMTIWIAKAVRPASIETAFDKVALFQLVSKYHRDQAALDLARYRDVREHLRELLRPGEYNQLDKSVLKRRAIQMAAIAATFCRRMEVAMGSNAE
jgi:SAM-dependent methyltransferase